MKKFASLLMALVISLALVACGGTEAKMDSYIEAINEQISANETPCVEIILEDREGALAIIYVLSDVASTSEGFELIGPQLEASVTSLDAVYEAFSTEIKSEVSDESYIILEYKSSDDVVIFSKEYK